MYELRYLFEDGNKTQYLLDTYENSNSSYYVNGKKRDFKFVDYTFFEINDKKYPVYKFVSNYYYDDGCISHFWSTEFGILLTKSTTWCNYKKLFWLDDNQKRQEINSLIEMMMLNYNFFYGCTEKYDLRKIEE